MNVRLGKEIRFWDDGNWNKYEWFKKGFWKRHFRKRFYKERLKDYDKAETGDKGRDN